MFTLIRGADLYTPDPVGVRDILVCGGVIARIAERIELPPALGAQVLDADGRAVVPGLVDLHVHLVGGGGEGGFGTRTPEITLSTVAQAGVTTVVGCLGTDDVTRTPEGLLAKARQLTAEGVSAYLYTGSYQLPPPTITGSVRRDIALIPEVVGVGEVAISDHRSSQPTDAELARLAAEARVGGMLGGKAGVVHCHLGSGAGGLDPILRIVRDTEIPASQFLPTHLTRTSGLLEQALAFAAAGGNIDLTVAPESLRFGTGIARALEDARSTGVPFERISLSTDGNGSMPEFDAQGNLVGLLVADIGNLWAEVGRLTGAGHPLAEILPLVTVNPARRVGLAARKGHLAEGTDADLLVLDPGGSIDTVMARGRVLVRGGQAVVRGTFER